MLERITEHDIAKVMDAVDASSDRAKLASCDRAAATFVTKDLRVLPGSLAWARAKSLVVSVASRKPVADSDRAAVAADYYRRLRSFM